MMQPDYSEEVILALRQLATADNDNATASPNDDPASVHIRAGALFARLKALNRDANAAARAHKQITADARHDMDQTHLRLQNLLYEKRHLEREIEKCRQFACVSPFFRFPIRSCGPHQLCIPGHPDVFRRTVHRAFSPRSAFRRCVVR